jgi:hypothetical protein
MFVGFKMFDGEYTFFHWDSGGAVVGEAGLLFFREAWVGRLSLAARVFVPLFTASPQSSPVGGQTISIFTLGLIAQI